MSDVSLARKDVRFQPIAKEGERMGSVAQGNDTTAYEDAHTEGESLYTWLED